MSLFLPTAREGNVFTGVCHSVHNRPHVYSVTAHPCYSVVGTHPTGMLSCSSLCLSLTLTVCLFLFPIYVSVLISITLTLFPSLSLFLSLFPVSFAHFCLHLCLCLCVSYPISSPLFLFLSLWLFVSSLFVCVYFWELAGNGIIWLVLFPNLYRIKMSLRIW